MGTRILYFAYGSNMITSRLQERIASARPVGRGRLSDTKLVCNKKSKDGSTKANLEDKPQNVVWGVLYEIDSSDLKRLDDIEREYQRTRTDVQTDEGKIVKAEVYFSTKISHNELPFGWYKELLIAGAQEHKLPKSYVEFLKGLRSKSSSRKTDT